MSEQSIILPASAPQGHHKDPSPMEFAMKIHRLFRGRYILAAVLATIGATAGVVGGYLMTKPKYMSTGSIRIRTILPKKAFDTEISRQIYNPYEMAQTHVNFLQEPRVIDKVLRSSAWRALGRPTDEASRDTFVDSLRVSVTRDQPNWIRVQFVDENREATKIAVDEVFKAYRDIYGATENLADPNLIEDLRNKRRAKETEIQQLQSNITKIVREFGTTNLAKLRDETELQFAGLDRLVRGIGDRIAAAEAQFGAEAPAPEQAEAQVAPAPPASELEELLATAATLARDDQNISQLLATRNTIARELESARRRGLQPAHRQIRVLEADLAAATDMLSDAVKDFRARSLPGVGSVADAMQEIRSPEDLKQAKARYEVLLRQRDSMKAELFKMEDKLGEITGLERDIKAAQEFVEQMGRRIGELTIEMPTDNIQGRIEIIPSIDSPFRPQVDNRKKYAVMGLAVGAGLPLAFVMLLGLLDRRVRYSEDAQERGRNLTLLGILPYLPNDMQDPEQASVAAHCVHQIRTLLQIGGADHSRKVFAITSPTSGDGKTSLAMSLGLSFAASGSRTLLLDFDMVGGGLSSAMGVKVERGLLDAVVHSELNGFVKPTNFPRLSIVPIGRDDAKDVSSLSLELVRAVIKQAKDQYDAVIIDTGPILGSLEASLVCAAADGTILTLGRGQARLQAERAMEHLAGIGATFLGVVFNRAEANDFKRAVSSASVRSRPLSDEERAMKPAGNLLLPQMGPVARIVASHIRNPGSQDGDNGKPSADQ